jgi:hypothetical protein
MLDLVWFSIYSSYWRRILQNLNFIVVKHNTKHCFRKERRLKLCVLNVCSCSVSFLCIRGSCSLLTEEWIRLYVTFHTLHQEYSWAETPDSGPETQWRKTIADTVSRLWNRTGGVRMPLGKITAKCSKWLLTIFDYEDGCLLGCCDANSGTRLSTFQRSLLPPSSGRWLLSTSEKSENFYQNTQPRRQPSSCSPPWEPQISQSSINVPIFTLKSPY